MVQILLQKHVESSAPRDDKRGIGSDGIAAGREWLVARGVTAVRHVEPQTLNRVHKAEVSEARREAENSDGEAERARHCGSVDWTLEEDVKPSLR